MEQVFDAGRPIAVKVRTPKGIETIRVRFPTDDEWIERGRKRKVNTVSLGRGLTETRVTDSSEFDAELLSRLRNGNDDGIEVSGPEATYALKRLETSDLVGEVEYEGGEFRVVIRILGGIETTHVFRMATAEEEDQFDQHFMRTVGSRGNVSQTILNLPIAADLYRAMATSTGGYAGSVPIIHQAFALSVAFSKMKAVMDDDEPKNF